jgi:hypothetical protein
MDDEIRQFAVNALVEDRFGVKFTDEDAEQLALMTLDEFTAEVAGRVAVPAGGAPE